MAKIYLSKNLKNEILPNVESRDKLIIISFASIHEEVKWMFLNTVRESFTTVLTETVIGFIITKKDHHMCIITNNNKVNIDVGANDIYIAEAKKDAPYHVEMVITLLPLDDREYDEVFSYPEDNQKEFEKLIKVSV